MAQQFFIDVSILISALYFGSLLFRKIEINRSWSGQLLYGFYLGVVSLMIVGFHEHFDGHLMLGFHLVPILLGALHGPFRVPITASLTAALFLLFQSDDAAEWLISVETLVAGMGFALIAHWKLKRTTTYLLSVLLSYLISFLSIAPELDTMMQHWAEWLYFSLWFIAALWGGDQYLRMEQTRRAFMEEYTYLTQHDLLTGLLNFQTFQAKLQTILEKKGRVCFILVDCDDVKSLNTEQGFHTVDGTLKNVAHLLREYFPNALLMGRHGSDEFAIVIPVPDHAAGSVKTMLKPLETAIPKKADIQLSYGYAVFPDEENDPNTFITLVQKRMIETKRRLWLEREAHWLHNERLMAVGELAAGMAHEIRNPLTTVKGFLQVSKQNNYNVSSYYDIIMHEIKRMSDLTAEFLQFSKPTAHLPTKISLQECVQTAIQLTESEITRNGHALEILAEEMPLNALLEKDKIVQVLVNIIRNGIDAMGENGTLTISIYPRGGYGLVEIADTGIGIPEEHMERLFKPFFSTKAKGTGLGLSISQKIIDEHGGYITIRSKVNVGTTFTIRLPLVERGLGLAGDNSE